MDETMTTPLEGPDDALRRELYEFFAQLFCSPVSVPGEDTARDLLRRAEALAAGSGEAAQDFAEFVKMGRTRPLEEVQRELAVERSLLFRGTQRERGPLPPCEGNYTHKGDEASTQIAVTNFYRRFGGVFESRERADYLGVECSFMAALIAETERATSPEDAAAGQRAQTDFTTQHLAWVPHFCAEAHPFAHTPFFAGALTLLDEFMESELAHARAIM